MVDKTVIGICGSKFSGKDEIAKTLVSKLDFRRYAFADPLKAACGLVFGLTRRQLHGDLKEVDFQLKIDEHTAKFGARSAAMSIYRIPYAMRSPNAMDVPLIVWNGLSTRFILDAVTDGVIEILKWESHTPRRILQFFGTDVCRRIHNETWIRSTMMAVASSTASRCVITDVRFVNEIDAIRKAHGHIIRVDRPSLTESGDTHSSENEWRETEPDACIVNDSSLKALAEISEQVALDLLERDTTETGEQ